MRSKCTSAKITCAKKIRTATYRIVIIVKIRRPRVQLQQLYIQKPLFFPVGHKAGIFVPILFAIHRGCVVPLPIVRIVPYSLLLLILRWHVVISVHLHIALHAHVPRRRWVIEKGMVNLKYKIIL